MIDLFPLQLFPTGSLDSSVVTTVLVGVVVVVFFNLRLGWVASGLVVPGYLVPLLISKPWSAVVITFEAIVTYLIVWGLFERFSRTGMWNSVFGRDRFFAIVLVSVVVRLCFDVVLLPGVMESLQRQGLAIIDYRSNLQSFGLVVIALMANQFWKPGLIRGLWPFLVITTISYVIVRFGLMTLTNFNISNLSYMYEDVATSILASPKAYIILLAAAFIASRMNLKYGWDFNGILLPALLALQWFQPVKVLATVFEAFIILFFARMLLASPLFARANIEGSRQLLFFFIIAYIYKFVMGHAMAIWTPELKVSDYYAFGYLLSTLLAVRMYEKEMGLMMARITMQTSLLAVVLASLVGFALYSFIPQPKLVAEDQHTEAAAALESTQDLSVADLLSMSSLDIYSSRERNSVPVPLPMELDAFKQAIRKLWNRSSAEQDYAAAAELLNNARFNLLKTQDGYFVVQERAPSRGWGVYVLAPQASSNLIIECPTAAERASLYLACVSYFLSSGARGLALSGASSGTNDDRSTDLLTAPNSIFHTFHLAVGAEEVLQFHLPGVVSAEGQGRIELGEENSLWVKRRPPEDLDMQSLERALRGLQVQWSAPAFRNIQRNASTRNFAELVLTEKAIRSLLARQILLKGDIKATVQEKRISGYLTEWLFADKKNYAARGSNLYQPPAIEELFLWDEEILTPLIRLIQQAYVDGQWTPDGIESLGNISRTASLIGYELILYRHRRSGEEYVILSEQPEATTRRYWGTYVFRLGSSGPYFLQVPRPKLEFGSFEFGVNLFENLQAFSFAVAGAHPYANQDRSADVIRQDNRQSIFNLTNQVLFRESEGMVRLALQSRTYQFNEATDRPQGDVLADFSGDYGDANSLDGLIDRLLRELSRMGLEVEVNEGQRAMLGYEVGYSAQRRYLDATLEAGLGVLYVSPVARQAYREQAEGRPAEHFSALGWPVRAVDLIAHVAAFESFAPTAGLPAQLRSALQTYQDTLDILAIASLQDRLRGWQLELLVDQDSRQAFVALINPQGALAGLYNPQPLDAEVDMILDIGSREARVASLLRFVQKRAGQLRIGGQQ